MLPLEQKLIFKALSQKEDSWRYWEQWQQQFNLDLILPSTYCLLPALYKTLEDKKENELHKLAGIYKRNFTNSEYKLHQATTVISALEDQGLAPIIINTPAIALSSVATFYNYCLNQIDVLISKANITNAIEILKNLGWGTNLRLKNSNYIKYRSYIPFWNSSGGKILLHWNSFYQRPSDYLNQSIIKNKTLAPTENKKLYLASIQDLFLHSNIHGAENMFSSCEWIYNSLSLGTNNKWQFDWQRLKLLAEESGNLNSFSQSMLFLKSEIGINEIPEELTRPLKTTIIDRIARQLCKNDTPKGNPGAMNSVGRFIFQNNKYDNQTICEFRGFVKENLEIESFSDYIKKIINNLKFKFLKSRLI